MDVLQQYRQLEERYQAVLTENEWLSAERARAQEAAEASGERDGQVQTLQVRVAELEALAADASLESERRVALLAEEARVAEAERDVRAGQLGELKERLASVQSQSLEQQERLRQELRSSEEARLSQLTQLTELQRGLQERVAAIAAAEAGAEALRKRREAELFEATERAAEAEATAQLLQAQIKAEAETAQTRLAQLQCEKDEAGREEQERFGELRARVEELQSSS